jgi:hypothetical protein
MVGEYHNVGKHYQVDKDMFRERNYHDLPSWKISGYTIAKGYTQILGFEVVEMKDNHSAASAAAGAADWVL